MTCGGDDEGEWMMPTYDGYGYNDEDDENDDVRLALTSSSFPLLSILR